MSILDLEALNRVPLQRDPCDYIVVPSFVKAEALAAVNHDFPNVLDPGNFPPHQLTCGAKFSQVLQELQSADLRNAFAQKFGLDLSAFPLQITVRKYSEESDGNIHNDSRTKIVTALIYFNEEWPHPGGALRLLRSTTDIDNYAVEVPPVGGTLLAFRRSETSYHGFKPCVGERRSLQMYWVKPKREVRDEDKAGSMMKRIKRLFKRG